MQPPGSRYRYLRVHRNLPQIAKVDIVWIIGKAIGLIATVDFTGESKYVPDSQTANIQCVFTGVSQLNELIGVVSINPFSGDTSRIINLFDFEVIKGRLWGVIDDETFPSSIQANKASITIMILSLIRM